MSFPAPSEKYDRTNEAQFRRVVEQRLNPATSKKYGPTTARPTRWPTGESWFDTTLGMPIWMDDSNAWVDATGTAA